MNEIKKVLILGSGAITIGQAGEFDYSGAQAIKAFREDGIKTVLVNPNIATIQTDEKFVDKVYFLPVKGEFVEQIIAKERPQGILLGFGGQTALNCGLELHEKGVLEKYDVRVLGTNIESIIKAGNRQEFKKLMESNGIQIPKSASAFSIDEAAEIANTIGYPVMVRVAYTLGGQGTGVAYNDSQLKEIASRGLTHSRIHQILVEEYLHKWKEVEYEVMRDREDNCIIICNMENFDPMGIHTGESIVVAPSQTLTNKEYHKLREMSFRVIRSLGIVGECNIQYAINPKNGDIRVIEVNSRLSRSSALASKATGYPIAYIAAKLSMGYALPELANKVTKVTTACFEPALDYVVVKIPRWDFQKFRRANRNLGTQMKSIGEVMSIGRNFEEALQKAVRMLDIGRELTDDIEGGVQRTKDELVHPTDKRIFYIAGALKNFSVAEVGELTGIDEWFIHKIKNIVDIEEKIKSSFTTDVLKEAKKHGFSDRKIGELAGRGEESIRALRKKHGIIPVAKHIDTMAAEWPAKTNYLYLTYGDEDDIEFEKKKKVIVLGSGCYRIGSSVEFDWCCVNLAMALKKDADEVVMINYNPETVSTDYDILDKLYFEELSLERIRDIIEKENPLGVVVSVGGQIPNNLALKLSEFAHILGTSAETIDAAEDRSKFSSLLDNLGISQPWWNKFTDFQEAKKFAGRIGYPVLIRPSYVLSGAAMKVVFNENDLEHFLKSAAEISSSGVVISKFFSDSREIEVDAVSDGKNVFIGAIIEHVENAGIHSGDATLVIPAFSITEDEKKKIIEATKKLSHSLHIIGPFNVQYLVKNGGIFVIECNIRASRSMPFVSKAIGINLMELAAAAIMGKRIDKKEVSPDIFAVKVPQFSFMRLEGADPVTGVEMVSTGEVACFGKTLEEAFVKALISSGLEIPKPGDDILITVSKKEKIIDNAKILSKRFKINATEHTAEELVKNGVDCRMLYKVTENRQPNILDYLVEKKLKLVINIINSHAEEQILEDEYLIRRKAVEYGIPVITNFELFEMLTNAITRDIKIEDMIEFSGEKWLR
ncbi:MAG: carbamoyl-phosphate synthase (glutamine-hydrolyzing) large subunit [Candidatus Aenigmarchaeota archaeon]|nr:carbamoyl-phosphate synthase (glutamine-hydrolyzing) large subunit [Candidatus Aenigmarchaeota archaeon]